jgi:hypothetical protein
LPKKPSITRISKNNAKNKKSPRVPGRLTRLKMVARELSKKQGNKVMVKRGK